MQSLKESQWHLLRWLKVGCLRGRQQPLLTPLLSLCGTRRRLSAALSLAVQTLYVNIKKPLRLL